LKMGFSPSFLKKTKIRRIFRELLEIL